MSTVAEARLMIRDAILDVLLDLALDEDLDELEAELTRDGMTTATDLILERIGLEVVSVKDEIVTATLRLA